jgi:hypothetical protein
MHRSWSMPVAQALQRHSGGWSAKPMGENLERDGPQSTGSRAPKHGQNTEDTVRPDDAMTSAGAVLDLCPSP